GRAPLRRAVGPRAATARHRRAREIARRGRGAPAPDAAPARGARRELAAARRRGVAGRPARLGRAARATPLGSRRGRGFVEIAVRRPRRAHSAEIARGASRRSAECGEDLLAEELERAQLVLVVPGMGEAGAGAEVHQREVLAAELVAAALDRTDTLV